MKPILTLIVVVAAFAIWWPLGVLAILPLAVLLAKKNKTSSRGTRNAEGRDHDAREIFNEIHEVGKAIGEQCEAVQAIFEDAKMRTPTALLVYHAWSVVWDITHDLNTLAFEADSDVRKRVLTLWRTLPHRHYFSAFGSRWTS